MITSSVGNGGTPIPLQVVFQGGGAKLCVLMAVCDVLKQYEAAGRVIVTRVAGSSAGAIAAVMLASNKPIDVFKARIRQIGPRFLSGMATSQWLGAWRAYRGEPYFGPVSLEAFFENLICDDGGPKKISDLRIDARVHFTDLYSLEARSAPKEESIPRALAKSCNFPFAFVGYSSGNTDVDGGLALNLPVD